LHEPPSNRKPGLDDPDVSAGKRSHENIGEFLSNVMAALGMQRWMAGSKARP
jgi:hypothetical protein